MHWKIIILHVKIYCHQSRIIEQANFTYSPLSKAFEKQIKAIKEQGKKQVEALKPITQILTIKDTIPEKTLSEEAKNELNKIKEIERTVDREKVYFKTNTTHIILRLFEH